MGSFPSFGSASSLASTVASPQRRDQSESFPGSASSLASTVASQQRRDQSESFPGGLTRQRNSNALRRYAADGMHRSAAEHCSVTGSGGSATTHNARRTRRRRHNDGLLREGGVA